MRMTDLKGKKIKQDSSDPQLFDTKEELGLFIDHRINSWFSRLDKKNE